MGRDLEDQPAQAALAANLRHPDYVRVLCGSLDNLPWAFADLDKQELANASPLVRNNRDSKLLGRIQTLIKSENSAEFGFERLNFQPLFDAVGLLRTSPNLSVLIVGTL